MAVTVPRLQRLQPSSSLPNNARVDIQATNQASSILNRTESIGKLASEGVDLYYDVEDNKIQQLSQDAELKFTQWNNDQLASLKKYEGDPTDAYVEYEKQAADKYDAILNERPDLNERMRRGVDANLSKAASNQRMAAMKQRGAQIETYENNLFESSVKLKKDNLGVTSGYIQKDDPGSFLPFDENINDIKTTIVKRGITNGTAKILPDDAKSWNHIYKNEDGKMVKVELSDMAKQRVAKELTEGVGASINSMIAAGYTDEAKAALTRYDAYLDPKTKASLNNKFKTNEVKTQAYSEVGKIESLPEGQRLSAIDKIEDPEKRSEVLKIINTNEARRKQLTDRRENANYETLASKVLKKMNSDNPYYGQADLENDPAYKAIFDRLDVKGQKAILEMVNAPKETNAKSENTVQSLFRGKIPGKDVAEMKPEEFNTYLAGLNKADRNKYENMYNRMGTQTGAQERASFKRASDMLKNQLLVDEHISRDKYGKISGDDEITYLNATNKLIDHLDKQGPMGEKELKDFVKNFSAAEIKGKVFNPQVKSVFNPAPKNPAVVAPPASPNDIALSGKGLVHYKNLYKKATKADFPTTSDPKFKNWLSKQTIEDKWK